MRTKQGKLVSKTVYLTKEGKLRQENIAVPLAEDVTGLGRPVTTEAADKMIRDYIAQNKGNLDQNIAIQFGREAILDLLSLKGCESIRFFFCIYEDETGKRSKSLVAMPLDIHNNPIEVNGVVDDVPCDDEGKPKLMASQRIGGQEVGGGFTIREFLEASNKSADDYLKSSCQESVQILTKTKAREYAY
jgi:hypothetical protein